MNSTNYSSCTSGRRLEIISHVLSSAGCSWNANETNDSYEEPVHSSLLLEKIPLLKIEHPSFSLSDNHDEEPGEEEGDGNISSTQQRELVQSKASKLMSRKLIYFYKNGDDNTQQAQHPQRLMLENILDSFDQLVDARIRAYAQILSNHVRALSESNNGRGARIAEYKLQTLLEVAANHLSFDSISTEFKFTTTENDITNGDSTIRGSTSTIIKDENSVSLPIELNVEIRSPRFFHEGLESSNLNDVAVPSHESHQGSLRFRAKGEVRGRRNFIGRCDTQANDTGRCSLPETVVCRNTPDSNRIPSIYHYENIEIDIDCNALLSQMIEEASKVVIMAVELTNLAWTNRSQKEEEFSDISMNDLDEKSDKVANIIVDEDDDGNVFTANDRVQERNTGKRSSYDVYPEIGNHGDSKMSKQVSELSFCPNNEVVRDNDLIEETPAARISESTTFTKITNLHILDEDVDRKTRYFVSDRSYDSSGSEHDTNEVCEDEKCPPMPENEEDESYNNIMAERACHIVDYVLAGDIIPSSFRSNKRLRTK